MPDGKIMKKLNTLYKISIASALLLSFCTFAQTNYQLPEIFIYGTKFQETIENSLPQTEIISSSEIQQSGLTNVGDVLQKMGNIYTRQDLSGNLNSSIDIRGYGATSDNNVLVLLDGVRLSENSQSSARIWTIPVEIIDHIEIVRGASSVLYGESSTAGVINIITNKQKNDFGMVSLGVGSYSTYQTTGYFSKTINDLKISVFEKSLNSAGFREQNNSQIRSGGLNLDYQFNPNITSGLRLGADTNNSILPGSLTQTQFAQKPNQPQYALSTLMAPNTLNNKNEVISSYLKIEKGDTQYYADVFRRTFRFTTVTSQPSGIAYNPVTLDAVDPYAYPSIYTGFQDGVTLRTKINNFLIPSNSLTLGADASAWQRDSNAGDNLSIDTMHARQKSGGGFVQDDIRVTNLDRLIIGYRVEFFNKKINDLTNPTVSQVGSTRLSAYEAQYTRELSKLLFGYVKIAESYRVPNADDLLGSTCATYYGNQNCINSTLGLAPQINKDYEIGSLFHNSYHKGHLKLYRTNIENEVVFDSTSLSNVNALKTFRQGLEVADQYKFNSNWNLRGSLNLIQAKFLTDQLTAPILPFYPGSGHVYNMNVSGVASYVLGAGFDYSISSAQSIGFYERVVGPQYAQGDNTNQIKLGAYSVADLSYRYKLKEWSFTSSVNNLFNRNYFDTAIYADNQNPTVPQYYSVYPNPGRNFNLLARYVF